MCGIIGYIGKNVKHRLIDGLEKLEYRGYDSAGLTILHNKNFYTKKAIGAVENLKNSALDLEFDGLGIAHTRWATHGGITIENCHPHFSQDENVALVHNGIIENFEQLKSELEKQGVKFYGQTDTEVIAKLFSVKLDIEKLKDVLNKIKGSYALVIACKENSEIYFAKNKSPLYIATGKEGVMLASDPSVFMGHTDEYIPLEDGEYGKISKESIKIYNAHGEIGKVAQKLENNFISAEKQSYPHFMLKEINESGKVLENIIHRYESLDLKLDIKKYSRIYLIGCGTAYHAGLMGQYYLKSRLKIDVFARKASEFLYNNDILDEKSLCIFISQSGETADTLSALEYAQKFKTTNVAVVNTEYSTLASKADLVLPICAGQEKAVASTKAYFGQSVVLYIFACILNQENYLVALQKYKNELNFYDDEEINEIAEFIKNQENCFFIGRGYDYISSKEAALKLKEITYIHAEAIESGELKHGTLALIKPGLPVFVIATNDTLFNKTLNNAYEVKSRGGELVLITSLEISKDIQNNFKYIIQIKDCEKALLPLQSMLPLQKLAYFTCIKRNLNPDKPRNLAKSVTVE